MGIDPQWHENAFNTLAKEVNTHVVKEIITFRDSRNTVALTLKVRSNLVDAANEAITQNGDKIFKLGINYYLCDKRSTAEDTMFIQEDMIKNSILKLCWTVLHRVTLKDN